MVNELIVRRGVILLVDGEGLVAFEDPRWRRTLKVKRIVLGTPRDVPSGPPTSRDAEAIE